MLIGFNFCVIDEVDSIPNDEDCAFVNISKSAGRPSVKLCSGDWKCLFT